VFFGWLSDKVGRKYIMMECIAILYRPIYKQMYETTVKNKTEMVENTKNLAELKEKKQTMDSIYD
jgi:hypothetical protein